MDHPGIDMDRLAAHGNIPPRKPRPVLLIVLGVVALLIVLIVLGAVSAFRAASGMSTAAAAAANGFITAMGAHNYRAASALCAPEIQTRATPAALKGIESLVEQSRGAYVSAGVPAWFVQNWNGKTSVRLTYLVQYAKGTETVSVVMVNTAGGYRVDSFNYAM